MENQLLEIPEKNIFLEFVLDGQLYAVLSKEEELDEGSEIYFAKVEYLDEIKIIRNIENDNEYEKVLREYERLCDTYGEGEN